MRKGVRAERGHQGNNVENLGHCKQNRANVTIVNGSN